MKSKRHLLVCILLIITTTLSGCSLVDKTLVKFGFRNTDFDYMINNKVEKIIIQNSRDTGFRFVVTDSKAINDIYKILREGEPKEKKTSLDSDYVFEIYLVGDEVKSYNYVVNLDEKKVGNFYNDKVIYDISSNLDETILNNLEFIRKPKNFNDIYYNSILKVLELKKKELTSGENVVGIDINGDVDCLKYMFSVDLEKFEKDINKIIPGAQLTDNNNEEFDTIITVNNNGYNTKLFKTVITVDNRKDKIYQTYYVKGIYEYKNWDIIVSEPDIKPSDW